MLTKEEVLQAVARGWCHENNANKEMDHDLAIAIAEEVIALRGMGVEAVGECVKATGSLKDMMIIRWRDGFTPHEGQLLYTAPAAAPENEALAKRLRELLERMSHWDQFHPPMTGDHGFWKNEIDKALAAFRAQGGERG
jgi:hypothetical protein